MKFLVSLAVLIALDVKSVASSSCHPAMTGIFGNFPSARSLLAFSGRKSWSTVGRKTSPSLEDEVESIVWMVKSSKLSMGRDRRQSMTAGDCELVLLQPARLATAV